MQKMRAILYILLPFNSFFCFCQSEKAVIKVYLEDANTGKNIIDANVILEGFKKTVIKGKFDKEGKFYYFTKIPNGYNTVMAYHKGYNEKGFQNTNDLPKELRLKLYTPYRVKIPNDTLNSYFEDSFKIAFLINDSLLNFMNNDNFKIIKSYFKKHYPELVLHKDESFNISISNLSFYVTKKNGKPFKRFNDPIIHKIENDNNILMTFGVLLRTQYYEPKTKSLKTFFTEGGAPVFLPKKIGYFHRDDLYKQYIVNDEEPDLYYDSFGIKRRGTITNVPDLFLSYKQKYKNGLLDNYVYTLNEKEEADLYQHYEDRKSKGYLYNFRIDFDNRDTAYFQSPKTIQDIERYPYNAKFLGLPYVFVSNILEFSSLSPTKVLHNNKYKSIYKILYKSSTTLYSDNLQRDYEKLPELIEVIKINNISDVYKLRNINASPYGIMDIIEFHDKKEVNLNYMTAY